MLTLIDVAIVTKCCGKNKDTINYAQNNNIYSLEKYIVDCKNVTNCSKI